MKKTMKNQNPTKTIEKNKVIDIKIDRYPLLFECQSIGYSIVCDLTLQIWVRDVRERWSGYSSWMREGSDMIKSYRDMRNVRAGWRVVTAILYKYKGGLLFVSYIQK